MARQRLRISLPLRLHIAIELIATYIQAHAEVYIKVSIDANPRIHTRIPRPVRPIGPEEIMQVQQRIAIQCDISTLPTVLTRLINQNKYDGGLQAN